MRDINKTKMQRDLDIQMAQQNMSDRYNAINTGASVGGALQSALQQGYGNVSNLQMGAGGFQFQNPFEGLFQGNLLQQELNKPGPSGNDGSAELFGGLLNFGASLINTPATASKYLAD
jgi:hypothetical protein